MLVSYPPDLIHFDPLTSSYMEYLVVRKEQFGAVARNSPVAIEPGDQMRSYKKWVFRPHDRIMTPITREYDTCMMLISSYVIIYHHMWSYVIICESMIIYQYINRITTNVALYKSIYKYPGEPAAEVSQK